MPAHSSSIRALDENRIRKIGAEKSRHNAAPRARRRRYQVGLERARDQIDEPRALPVDGGRARHRWSDRPRPADVAAQERRQRHGVVLTRRGFPFLDAVLARHAAREAVAEVRTRDQAERRRQADRALVGRRVGGDGDNELGDLFADAETADPTEEAEDSLRAEAVRKALAELGERERRVLALRFGFEGEPLSLDAIARELGLSRERVRQLEREALDRLEGELVAQGVEDGDLARSA